MALKPACIKAWHTVYKNFFSGGMTKLVIFLEKPDFIFNSFIYSMQYILHINKIQDPRKTLFKTELKYLVVFEENLHNRNEK